MTIKPVALQKRNGGAADAENNEALSNAGIAVGETSGSALGQQGCNSSALGQRNAVDAHNKNQATYAVDVVFDELTRNRNSPHKTRSKRREMQNNETLKRERKHNAEAHMNPSMSGCENNAANNCNNSHSKVGSSTSTLKMAGGIGNNQTAASANGAAANAPYAAKKLPEYKIMLNTSIVNQVPTTTNPKGKSKSKLLEKKEDCYSGYNSGDEHMQPKVGLLSAVEWRRRDEQFAKYMKERGYVLKPVEEDGACLFRSIALQIYGDENMHDVIRQHTMDYIYKNREYFGNFVTEDINSYITRKRRKDSHGNHIEIQAMSEIYNRPVEIYCYQPNPINIFNSAQLKNGHAPLRLSYQRCSHYNAIIDPYNATVGVGLGLAGYKPEVPTSEALRLSEQLEIEQTMFEDKLKTSDWEATNDAIEEQIARESYLEWCRENMQKSHNAKAATATVTTTTTATIASPTAGRSTDQALISVTSMATSSDAKNTNANANVNANTNANAKASGKAAIAKRRAADMGAAASSSKSETGKKMDKIIYYESKREVVNDFKGFESDDTDISSNSSLNESVGDNYYMKTRERTKKLKMRTAANLTKFNKKLRRDFKDNSDGKAPLNLDAAGIKSNTEKKQMDDDGKRSITADMEQQLPSTSKQSSNAPETQRNNTATNDNGTNTSPNGAEAAADDTPLSSFYHELLKASYRSDGLGQLSESEMLQRAIQLSTQDYIEDQKHKYLYGS